MEKKVVLEVKNLSKKIGKKEILKDLNFITYESEIIGLLGPNGSGKTTTMKCISGAYIPTEGTININGYDIVKQHEYAMEACGISIDGPVLYHHLKGIENLKIMGKYKKVSNKKIEEIASFSGLGNRLYDSVDTYSLGMKQRLSLSMTIMNDPKLILLDEPTNGLDPEAVFLLREELNKLKQKGASIIISSHSLGEIEKIADRSIFIKDGEILETVTTDNIFEKILKYRISVQNLNNAIQEIPTEIITKIYGNNIECAFIDEYQFTEIIKKISSNNLILYIEKVHVDLETIYKEMYGGAYVKSNEI